MSDVNLNTFKCPKCGADIKFNKGDEYTTCEFCGTTVQIPKTAMSDKTKIIIVGMCFFILVLLLLYMYLK